MGLCYLAFTKSNAILNTQDLKRNRQAKSPATSTTTGSSTSVVTSMENETAAVVRASKRRKVAPNVHERGLVTEAVVASHDDAPDHCFGPAMDAALAPVLQRLAIVEARQSNSVSVQKSHRLQVIPNAAGMATPHFPRTFLALQTMKRAKMTAFWKHYGLLFPGNDEITLHRIKRFIAIRGYYVVTFHCHGFPVDETTR